MLLDETIFYFGCKKSLGHYLYSSDGKSRKIDIIPWGYDIDGLLAPSTTSKQGKALLHHKDGWTALSFWDNSVDKRPKSCSTFLAQGIFDFEQMKAIAKDNFPDIWERYSFEITPVD